MTTTITLHCDRQWHSGTCPTQAVVYGATTIRDACAAARRIGWATGGAHTGDLCPQHSGLPGPRGSQHITAHTPAPATVTTLRRTPPTHPDGPTAARTEGQ